MGANRALWHFVVIAVVMVLSVGLAFQSNGEVLTLVLVGLTGILLVQQLSKNIVVGLALVIPISFFVSFGFAAGNGASVGLNLILIAILTVLWLLGGVSGKPGKILPESAAIAPLLLFCAVALVALAFGQLPWFAFADRAPFEAQVGGLATFLLSAATFLLAATQIRSLKALRWITWTFLVTGTLVVASAIFSEYLSPILELIPGSAAGSMFWVWFAALAFSQAISNAELHRGLRLVLLIMVLGIFQLNLFGDSSWASGWVPPLAAMIAIIWAATPQLAAGLTIIGAAGVLSASQAPLSFLISTNNEYSLLTRLEAWRIVGEIVKVNPILGLGPANYYWYAPLFPILGFSVRFNSHNNYVDIVAQTGILGLFLFLWFAFAMARLAWRLLGTAQPGFERAFIVGVTGGLVGTLVAGMFGDWVIPFVYNIGLHGMRASLIGWLFLGGLVALEQMRRRAPERS